MTTDTRLINFCLPSGLKDAFFFYCAEQSLSITQVLRHLAKEFTEEKRNIPVYEPYEVTGDTIGLELPIETWKAVVTKSCDMRMHQSAVYRNLMRQCLFRCEQLNLKPEQRRGRKPVIKELPLDEFGNQLIPPKALPKRGKAKPKRPKAKTKPKEEPKATPKREKIVLNALPEGQTNKPPGLNKPKEQMRARSLRCRYEFEEAS